MESRRKEEETWEDLQGTPMNDPNYSNALERWMAAADVARADTNRALVKMFQEEKEKTKELQDELDDLKAKIPPDDPCDEEFMEEISS